MATQKMTANEGAAIERKKLLAKLRRMREHDGVLQVGAYNRALDDLAEWVRGSAPRASAKAGGLGRR
jgi:hypothetical protein